MKFTLTLIWVDFLGVRFEVWGVPPCLKPVKIMLETSNLARKYISVCSFRKYTFQDLDPLSFADVSIFLQKISVFSPKKYFYSKQKCESCVFFVFFCFNFLVLFSVFVRQKLPITENITFAGSVCGIRPPDCRKLAKNPKNDNDVIIFRHDVNVIFF